MGMSRSPGDVPRCERADEHHRPAEQVSSPAKGSEYYPPSSIFPVGKEAHGIPENSHAFIKWKKHLVSKGELIPLSLDSLFACNSIYA